jgi:hypothetical protein
MMARANRNAVVVAIQYLSLRHRSLLVAADIRMSSTEEDTPAQPSRDRATGLLIALNRL